MFRLILRSDVRAIPGRNDALTLAFIGGNLFFNIVANTSFKLSAMSENWRGFLFWQVIGNLAGFITVLTLTGLFKYLPLHVAVPLTTGLAVIGVQVVAAGLLFREAITPAQWLGTLLVAAGIALISGR
jgi:multidrug transporter EmrE-like cation transporter